MQLTIRKSSSVKRSLSASSSLSSSAFDVLAVVELPLVPGVAKFNMAVVGGGGVGGGGGGGSSSPPTGCVRTCCASDVVKFNSNGAGACRIFRKRLFCLTDEEVLATDAVLVFDRRAEDAAVDKSDVFDGGNCDGGNAITECCCGEVVVAGTDEVADTVVCC